MSLLAGLFGEANASNAAPWDDFWYQPLPFTSSTGLKINEAQAMRISAVYACVRILAETIASLPLFVYRRLPNGDKEKATDHPLFDILHTSPNRQQTAFTFFEQMQGFLALRGNAYAEIITDRIGNPVELRPLPATWVIPKKLIDGEIVYEVSQPNAVMRRVLADDMFHLPALAFNGLVGISPIRYAANSMGLSLAAETYGSAFFKNDANPGGVYEVPEALSDKAYKRLKSGIKKTHGGATNAKNPMILEEGLKWHQVSMAPNEAQFLETRKFQDVDIAAKIYRVPPHMIGIMDNSALKNIESQSLSFVINTIRPWLVRWEQMIDKSLIVDNDTYFAEFTVDGLLRGDSKARTNAYKTAILTGWMSRNEVRRLENMNSVDGLDEFLIPLNMGDADGDDATSGGRGTEEDIDRPTAMLEPLINDAAGRIVSAEIREVEKGIDRASGDNDKFSLWADRFYINHAKYVHGVLGPLTSACAGAGIKTNFKLPSISLGKSFIHISDLDSATKCMEVYKTDDYRLEQIKQVIWEGIEK